MAGERIVVVGASHGGPAVLARLLRRLPPDFELPVILVQHIGTGRSEDFARWLGGKVHLPVEEASEGTVLRPGRIHVAPGGRHLRIAEDGALELVDGEPGESSCPSVDVLFRSAAASHGSRCAAVLLCGLGKDGAEGIGVIREAGGVALVQDAASSPVHGMAGEAIARGHADLVGSPDRLADALLHWVRTGNLPAPEAS